MSNLFTLKNLLEDFQSVVSAAEKINTIDFTVLQRLSADGQGNLFFDGNRIAFKERITEDLISNFSVVDVGYDFVDLSWDVLVPDKIADVVVLLNGDAHYPNSPTSNQIKITEGVKAYTNYTAVIQVTDINGDTHEWGTQLTTKAGPDTEGDVPDASNAYFSVLEVGSREARIEFGQFENADEIWITVNGVLFGISSPLENYYNITNLEPSTYYEVAVFARNAFGESTHLTQSFGTNADSLPNASTAYIQLRQTTEQSITIEYSGFDNATKYHFYLNGNLYQSIETSNTFGLFTFQGLDAATEYTIEIVAENAAGTAKPVEIVTGTRPA